MPVKHTFLLVEGRHDAEFLARLLGVRGFRPKRLLTELAGELAGLIPRSFPVNEMIPLTTPQPVPSFYEAHGTWVSILIGGGAAAAVTLANALRTAARGGFQPDAIGVVIDQDQHATAVLARDAFLVEFAKQDDLPARLDFNIPPGGVPSGTPRVGLFVLPDNRQPGALEDLLLECGDVNYAALKRRAEEYAEAALTQCGLTDDDLRREYGRPGGQKYLSKRKKAVVGVMGGILKPAAAVQNSIRDNRWLEAGALALPCVKAVSAFLDELIR